LSTQAQTAAKTATPLPSARAATGLLQRKCACGNHASGGQCDECADKKNLLQRQSQHSELGAQDFETVPPIVHEVLNSPGQPLDRETRQFFEPRFGHDFSNVRVHTDAKAAESARRVNALAYTVGANVVFGSSQYAPATSAGRALIAHELTHTMQQGLGMRRSSGELAMTNPGDAHEQEADVAASAVLQGYSFTPSTHQSIQLARYGHAWSCKDDEHLKPFIWPGHDHAKRIIDRARQETDGRPLNSQTKSYLENFFGTGSADPGNLRTIHGNFQKIGQALDQQHLYHCVGRGARSDPDALPCVGNNARTDPSGKHDITLCFDQIGTWWSAGEISGAAWLIVHENFHRAGTWGHSWEAGKFDRCILNPPHPSVPDLINADAYACFAALVATVGP